MGRSFLDLRFVNWAFFGFRNFLVDLFCVLGCLADAK